MSSTKPLRGTRVVSLALNLPGPAALMRLAQMGATCTKINPPSGDPMQHYTPDGYALMHKGVKHHTLDLKTDAGQAALHKLLGKTDVLLTSFRPSALTKLGLGWKSLHKQYPALSLIEVVGAPGPLAEIPGHDLTYQAEVGLVNGMDLPPSLFADMGGALMAGGAKAALWDDNAKTREKARDLLKDAPGIDAAIAVQLLDGRQDTRAFAADWLASRGATAELPAIRAALKTEKSDIARAATRAAERAMVALAEADAVNPAALAYINRLSDYLFVLARVVNDNGKRDVKWVPGANR